MGFNMNLPYEVTAAGMLIITLIFYNYKNWLDLRKNRIFRDILLAGSIFLAVDSFVEYLAGLSFCHDHRGIYSKGRTFGNGLSGR